MLEAPDGIEMTQKEDTYGQTTCYTRTNMTLEGDLQ